MLISRKEGDTFVLVSNGEFAHRQRMKAQQRRADIAIAVRRWLGWIAFFVIAGAVALMAKEAKAQERDQEVGWRRVPRVVCDSWTDTCQREWRWRRVDPGPRVYGYSRRDDDRDDRDRDLGRDCRPFRRAVGDQALSVPLAQGQADKAWGQEARWAIGERHMDMANADRVTYECSRSSVGEVLGQVFYRCEVKARPCRGRKTDGGEARR